MKNLFSSKAVGPYEVEHRVVLAPLTRMRTKLDNVPGDLMVDYYTQRATKGGLLITDATAVSPLGIAYVDAPGIYTEAHVQGWKRVVDAVHAKGARIFLQTYGTMSDSDPHSTFRYVAEKLNAYDLAYLHVIEPRVRGIVDIGAGEAAVWSGDIRRWFKGTLMVAGGFTGDSAERIVAEGGADLVAFGRLFISNPDLPLRLRHESRCPTTTVQRSTAATPKATSTIPLMTRWPWPDLCLPEYRCRLLRNLASSSSASGGGAKNLARRMPRASRGERSCPYS
ncbi:hypothetical protein CS8_087130 [Cupriavidus sp. 8B]